MSGIDEEDNKGKEGDQEQETLLRMEREKTQLDNDRLESVKNINKWVREVGSIFTKMTTIVKMQEGIVERIDHNSERTSINVDKGKKEIKSIYDDVSSNRMLILKVFAIIIVFSVFYVVVLA